MRRKVVFEFTASCQKHFGTTRTSDNMLNDARISRSGQHDMMVSHIEFAVYENLARKEFPMFEEICDTDWVSIYLSFFNASYFTENSYMF